MFAVMAEQESYAKFTSIIDQIFENIEDSDIVGNEGIIVITFF